MNAKIAMYEMKTKYIANIGHRAAINANINKNEINDIPINNKIPNIPIGKNFSYHFSVTYKLK